MILLTVIAIAISAFLEWARSRNKWIAPAITCAVVLFILFVLPDMMGSGPVAINMPTQTSVSISVMLVVVYMVLRRAYMAKQIIEGKRRSPFFDFIRENFLP